MSAGPHVWRQALPVDPSLGEYPEASQVRPGLFTRFVPVAGRDWQLPPIQTTSGRGPCWLYAPIPSCPEIGMGGLEGAGALMARRPGGAGRSVPAAPPAG